MAQKKEVYKEKFKHTGYWNYKEVYDFLFHWFHDHQYKIHENLYNEKIIASGKEVIIKWEAEKKVTDYFKYQVKADWHILHMKDVEVEVDGKKVKTQNGEVEIIFKGILIKDYEKRWEDKPFWKFFRGIYEQYVIRETVDEFEDHVEDDVREMIGELKAMLKLEAPITLERPR
jgi:hypothetical protein